MNSLAYRHLSIRGFLQYQSCVHLYLLYTVLLCPSQCVTSYRGFGRTVITLLQSSLLLLCKSERFLSFMWARVSNVCSFINQVHTMQVFDNEKFLGKAKVTCFVADFIRRAIFQKFPAYVRVWVELIVPHISCESCFVFVFV